MFKEIPFILKGFISERENKVVAFYGYVKKPLLFGKVVYLFIYLPMFEGRCTSIFIIDMIFKGI